MLIGMVCRATVASGAKVTSQLYGAQTTVLGSEHDKALLQTT